MSELDKIALQIILIVCLKRIVPVLIGVAIIVVLLKLFGLFS